VTHCLSGIWEASCVISLEIFSHTVALPKTAPKAKNINPVWNKAVHFDLDAPNGKSLSVVINETSDTGQQTPIETTTIPLDSFQGIVGGQEGVRRKNW
jgi:Ca2+-dependent lipid-binding protein